MSKKELQPEDKKFLENPNEYALMKEKNMSQSYEYTIFTKSNGKLMMFLFNDHEYSQQLSKRMLAKGVLVFDRIGELQRWAKE